MVYYDLELFMAQFLDYRKSLEFKSNTFYFLYKDLNLSPEEINDPQFKSLIVGPINSKRNIRTTKSFYNNSGSEAEDKSYDFVVNIKMEADGVKVIDVQMKELKLFLKIDILYVIQNFFMNNFPAYQSDSFDKPTFFEADYTNYPRFSIILNLNDCLTCFEQMTNDG